MDTAFYLSAWGYFELNSDRSEGDQSDVCSLEESCNISRLSDKC